MVVDNVANELSKSSKMTATQCHDEREEGRRGWSLVSDDIEGEAMKDRERDSEQEERKRLQAVT